MPKRRIWTIGGWVAAGVVVLAAIGAVVTLFHRYMDYGQAACGVDAAARAYRASGMPWEAKDLSQGPVPPSQNAAPLIHRAISALGKTTVKMDIRTIQRLLARKAVAEADARLKPYRRAVAFAEEAADKPSLDYERDWDQGPETTFPELRPIKDIVGAICLRAQVLCLKGKPDQASKELRSAWNLGILTGQEPTISALLAAVKCRRTVLDGLQRCAADTSGNVAGLAQLASVVQRPGPLPDFGNALKGEAYSGLATIRNMYLFSERSEHEDSGTALPPLDRSVLVRSGIPEDLGERVYLSRHLEVWTKAKAAMDRCRKDPEKLQAALNGLGDSLDKKTGLSYLLTAISFPIYSRIGTVIVELDAETAATRALLSAFQIRARTGRWPNRIEDFAGSEVDPFTGQPLRIKRSGDGFRVYSLGPNRKDDGGVRQSELKRDADKTQYDVVASYPPKAP